MAYLPIKKKQSFEGMSNPFYNSRAWRKLSRDFRQCNPLCTVCFKKGIVKRAAVVDHIIPIRMGGEPLDWDNLQSLCHKCHNKKSGREAHSNTSFNNFETR